MLSLLKKKCCCDGVYDPKPQKGKLPERIWMRDQVQHLHKKFCIGCGICTYVCPYEAINIGKERNGFFPLIDSNLCTHCGICTKICPITQSLIENSKTIVPEYYDDFELSDLIGAFKHSYVGTSSDEDVELKASSGGIISSLLISLFEKKVIDGAFTVVQNMNFKSTSDLFVIKIAKTRDDVLSAQGSKYTQVSMEDALCEIIRDSTLQRIVFIGTGCQIRALKTNKRRIKALRNRSFYYFGLFCKQTKKPGFIDYILKIVGKSLSNLTEFRFRDGHYITVDGEKLLSFKDWKYGTIPWFTHQWSCEACLLCGDVTAELADISFGDAWLPEYRDIKKSIFITRNDEGDKIINQAVRDNAINIEEIDPYNVAKSQGIKAIIRKKLMLNTYAWLFNKDAKISVLNDVFTKHSSSFISKLYAMVYLYFSRFLTTQFFLFLVSKIEIIAKILFKFSMKILFHLEKVYLTSRRRKEQ